MSDSQGAHSGAALAVAAAAAGGEVAPAAAAGGEGAAAAVAGGGKGAAAVVPGRGPPLHAAGAVQPARGVGGGGARTRVRAPCVAPEGGLLNKCNKRAVAAAAEPPKRQRVDKPGICEKLSGRAPALAPAALWPKADIRLFLLTSARCGRRPT